MHQSIPLELRILESRVNAHIRIAVGLQTLITIAIKGEKHSLGSIREWMVSDEPRAYRQPQRVHAVQFDTIL